MIDKIYEHLKTKKKYNTLQLKYDVKCDELQAKIVELNTEKRIRSKQQELYEAKIKELTEKNVELESKLAEAKKELKKCTKTKKR